MWVMWALGGYNGLGWAASLQAFFVLGIIIGSFSVSMLASIGRFVEAFILLVFLVTSFIVFILFILVSSSENEANDTDYVKVADCGEIIGSEFHKNFLSAPKHIIHSKGCETVFVHANKSNLNLSPGNSIQLKVKKKRLFVCQEEVCSKRIDVKGQHMKSD